MNIDGELKPHRLDDFVTFYKRLVKMVEMSRQQFASDE
jgi:hypothetical protein